jgi:hypothetical protein
MKNLLRIASVAVVSAIVLLTIVAVLTPRVVRAVTAELVQNVDSPPRNPWSQSCIANSDAAGASCTISVPSNQEITIQTVTFNGTTSPDHDHLVLLLETTAGGNDAQWNNQFTRTVIPATGGNASVFFFSQALTLYADPGSTIYVNLQTAGANKDGMGGVVTLVGYTVTITPPTGVGIGPLPN